MNPANRLPLALFLFLLATTPVQATDYHVSAAGEDSHPGTLDKPWKTVAQVNRNMRALQPGDRILFRRGDAFEGGIVVACSGSEKRPVTFASYGAGSPPVIRGARALGGWSQDAFGRWSARREAGTTPPGLIINGSFQALARYPDGDAENGGYLRIRKHVKNERIESDGLASLPDVRGCEAVVRSVFWVLDRTVVVEQGAESIVVRNDSTYDFADGYGFFLQNHPAFLSRNGEWCVEPGTSLVRVLWQDNLEKAKVEIPVTDTLLSVDGRRFIVVRDLRFYGARESAVSVVNSSDIALENVQIVLSARTGLTVGNSSRVAVSRCRVEQSQDRGINTWGLADCAFTGNDITSSGILPGMGLGKDGHYFGVILAGDRLVFNENKIFSTGYIPLSFNGNHIVIERNRIDHYAFVKNDAGGIYCWSDGRVYEDRLISHNIITGGVGVTAGTPYPTLTLVEGIYIDDRQTNVDIRGNTIAGIPGDGVKVHNARQLIITGNTLVNNGVQIGMYHDSIAPEHPISGCVVEGNLLVCVEANQRMIVHQSIKDDLEKFALYRGNRYLSLFVQDAPVRFIRLDSGAWRTKLFDSSGWKTIDETGAWRMAHRTPFEVARELEVNRYRDGGFDQATDVWYAWAERGNSRLRREEAQGDGRLVLSLSRAGGLENSSGLAIGPVGPVEKSRTYLVSFECASAVPGIVYRVIFRKDGHPYYDLDESVLLPSSPSPAAREIFFTSGFDELKARVDFEVPAGAESFWIDNISFRAVEIKKRESGALYRIEWNETAAAKTLTLAEAFTDAAGKPAGKKIILPPFQSLVLVKPF